MPRTGVRKLECMAEQPKGIMRSLGEFFGHIARGIATDPAAQREPPRTVVREETTERDAVTADGQRVILRRTVIEEVEVVPEDGRPASGGPDTPRERAAD